MPVENLLSPDALRRVLWTPPEPADLDAVAAALRELGARPWQVDLAAPIVVAAIEAHPQPVERLTRRRTPRPRRTGRGGGNVVTHE